MDLPQRLGPYRILGLLGEGGMGVVYSAEHVETGTRVAVKTTRVPYGSEIAGLRCEIHALTHVRHPGVVRIVDEGLEDDLPWYAMELLEGRTLDDYRAALWKGAGEAPADAASREAPIDRRLRLDASSSETVTFAGPDAKTTAENAETVAIAESGEAARAMAHVETVEILRAEETVAVARSEERLPLAVGSAGLRSSWRAPPPPPSRPPPPPSERRPPAAAGRLDDVLLIVRRLCSPLAFLHGAGIVHRDLKPTNVFIRDDGTPVLMDFGLVSRFYGAGGREVIDESTAILGTAAYMSPEQILGQIVDARSDLYALGCILYELLTGHTPFEGATPLDILRGHIAHAALPPSSYVDGVPFELDGLVLRLLAKEPRQRIGHADDLSAMLGAIAGPHRELAPEIAASAYLYRPQLAGRDDALAAFKRYVTAALGGEGRCVLVGGESGVGKTYFAAAVAREATLRGVSVVTGECLPVATPDAGAGDVRGAPLHPFRRLFEAITDRCREGGAEAADRVLGARGKILAAYEPLLRHLPGQDAYPEPPEVPAQAARRRILAALGESLAAFAREKPLLLILDDLQWADELSLDFLRSLDEAYFTDLPLLVLGTYRSEEVGDALREALEESSPARTRVDLGRLDEETVGAIIGDMLAMARPPASFVRVLARRSAGNPFFVAEYLRAAVAERLLYRERGAWRVATDGEATEATYEALPLPGSLRELVERRLDGLDERARDLVAAAAVLGREVDGELLVAVADMPQPEALAAVKELLGRQVLEEVRPGRFRFVHDKLREIAYDRTPEPLRRALHRAGARAIEQRHAGTSAFPLVYSELAYHFGEAGDLVKAIDYLEKAGLDAEKRFANREAARFFGQALELDDRAEHHVEPLRRAVWLRRLGNAYLGLGKLVESQESLHRAVALLGFAMPGALWQLAPSLAREVARQVVHRVREPRWERLPPAEREVLLEAARAYDLLLQVSYYVTGDLLRILYTNVSHLNLAERAGPSPELALAYGNAHFTAGLIPVFPLARTYARRAHEILEGVSDASVRSWVYVLAGAYATGVGAWEEALALGKKADAIAEEVGFRRRAEEALGVMGGTYNLMGDFVRGRDTSQAIFHSALRGDPQTQVWGQSGVAMNCALLGELDRALAAAERSTLLISQKLGRPEKIFCYGVLALARFRKGDRRGAAEAAEAGAAAIAEGTPIAFYAITAYSYIADVFLDLWEESPPGSAERRALERKARRSSDHVIASARVFPVHRPHALLVRGRCAAISGDLARAHRFWEKSLEAARKLRMPYDEALAERTIALHLDGGASARRARLGRAAALFRATQARWDLALAEDADRRLGTG